MAEEYEQQRTAALAEFQAQREFLPIFVCNVAMPGVQCPLHIFEPRYRYFPFFSSDAIVVTRVQGLTLTVLALCGCSIG